MYVRKLIAQLAVGAAFSCCSYVALNATDAKSLVLYTARYILLVYEPRSLSPHAFSTHSCFGRCRHPDCIGKVPTARNPEE